MSTQNTYYHYTSRLAAQNIICTGVIFPNQAGELFLTPDIYTKGYEAANFLAITNKPVEIRFEVHCDITSVHMRRVRNQRKYIHGKLRRIRKGGGMEIVLSTEVSIRNPGNWTSLDMP